MIFLGIDPGWSGAIATIERRENGSRRTSLWKMPETDVGIAVLAKKLATLGITGAVLELVNTRPGEAQPSVWKFAANFFGWKMALLLVGIEYDLVQPQIWQKEFALIVPGISKIPDKKMREKAKREKKNLNKAEAQRQFPSLKVTLANCDALLIARYAELRFTPRSKFL